MTLALVVGDLLKRLDSFERRLRIVYPRLYTTIALWEILKDGVNLFDSHFQTG